jgi:hypothetical protein
MPSDVASLKAFIEREIVTLRADVRRSTDAAAPGPGGGDGSPPGGTLRPAGPGVREGKQCPCGQGHGTRHTCVDAGEDHDPWRCLCSTLPAIPVSAALLTPLRDDSGTVTDFVISAGNHIRSTEWLESPDRQAGQRFFEVARPGAAARPSRTRPSAGTGTSAGRCRAGGRWLRSVTRAATAWTRWPGWRSSGTRWRGWPPRGPVPVMSPPG